jgi:hypothetical protein
MHTLYQIMGIAAAILVLYFLYRTIKGRPDLFSRENLHKSFLTMGFLGVGLIGFVFLLVMLVRYS